jgi:hypothetical protein
MGDLCPKMTRGESGGKSKEKFLTCRANIVYYCASHPETGKTRAGVCPNDCGLLVNKVILMTI